MTPNRSSKPDRCLTMMIRHPEPGKVKTRLAKAYGDRFAAELYGYFVDDLIERLERKSYHLELTFTPKEKDREIRKRFGARFSYTPQKGNGLGERMDKAFRSCFAKGFSTAILIGSDAPDLTAEVIEQAFIAMENGEEAVIGPAFDGGYYLIGFRSDTFDPAIFKGMPWGERTVFEKTVNGLRARRYRLCLTPRWHDIDTDKDLADLRARHGNTPFSHSRTIDFLRTRLEMSS